MKKFLKRVSTSVLALLMATSFLSVSASNEELIVSTDYEVYSVGASEIENYVDKAELKAHIAKQLWEGKERIDVSSFKLPFPDGLTMVMNFIIEEMPEIFFIDSSFSGSGSDYLKTVIVTYLYSAEEIATMKAELDETIDEMVYGIENNDSLTDVEKALLLHDRLAAKCQYDYTYSIRDSYSALVDGVGVCDGYTKAYAVLLNRVGIQNERCVSDALNHAWNIVYIDGKPYHVDVTWDDIAWDSGERGVLGYVQHENFLRSTDGMVETKHTATDYNSAPKDTTYDNYFWQSSETVFVLLNGEIYYIDGNKEKLMRYSDKATLCDVSDTWIASGNSYYVDSFARLTTDGKYLYYSKSKAVYKYDVKSGESEKIFEPALSGINSIYGLDCKDGVIICDVGDGAPFGNYTSFSQITYTLPKTETEIVISPSSSLTESEGFLMGISEQTTVAVVLSQIENSSAVIYDNDGNALSDTDLCGTGCKVSVVQNGVVVDSLEIVVLGDTDGSGEIDTTDYLKIKAALLDKEALEGAFFIAGDAEKDGELTITDFARVKSHFLGIGKI